MLYVYNMSVLVKSALISVHSKGAKLAKLVTALDGLGVYIYASGGTLEFIRSLGIPAVSVSEDLTHFPEILGGRVKTLHPHVFGGILYKRGDTTHEAEVKKLGIPPIDLVVVDLYPFEKVVATVGATVADIVENIDIGGVSLIRAAAKNYESTVVICREDSYEWLAKILHENKGCTTMEDRRVLSGIAFEKTCEYDGAISRWFAFLNRYTPASL